MGQPGGDSPATIHLIEPPRRTGGRDRGRESSLLALAVMRERGLLEPGPIVVVGDGLGRDTARAYGVSCERTLTPVAGRIGPSWRAIQRELAGAASVRCWSVGTLRVVAAIAALSKIRRVRATLVEAPRGRWDALAVSRLADRLERLDVFDEDDGLAWRALGVPSDRAHVHDAFPLPIEGDRISLPQQFQGQRVLTTLGDSPFQTDARRFSFLLAILSVGEYAAVGLTPIGARKLEAGRRYWRQLGGRYGFRVSPRPTIDMLRAADMCVWPDPTERNPARGARNLLRAMADRLGVTIIDPPEYANPAGPTPPEMVRPALRLFDHPRDAAHAEAEASPAVAGGV